MQALFARGFLPLVLATGPGHRKCGPALVITIIADWFSSVPQILTLYPHAGDRALDRPAAARSEA